MSFLKPSQDVFLLGPSAFLPERVLNNDDVMRWLGSEARGSWIAQRTGVTSRHWASDEQACSDLARAAAQRLFHEYGIDRRRIAQLVLATVSGDFPSPPTSTLLMEQLEIQQAGAMDVAAACAGFVSGLHVSAALAASTGGDQLLISSEIRSKFLRKGDLATAALFGDGSAAAIVTPRADAADFRLVATELSFYGMISNAISIPAGGSRLPHHQSKNEEDGFLTMKNGAALFLKAVEIMEASSSSILSRCGMALADVDWIVPHQANLHMLRALEEKIQVPRGRIVETVSFTGNTSGASVAIALHHLRTKLKPSAGQKILLVSPGAGGSAACALLECLRGA